MATVYAKNGELIVSVDDNLFKDFLAETLVDDVSIEEYFSSLSNSLDAKKLNDYIIWRLAEVSPGHTP